MLKMPNFAEEHTKRRVQDRRIESQPIASSDKHTKSQDLQKEQQTLQTKLALALCQR
jgi:hypothetical protein